MSASTCVRCGHDTQAHYTKVSGPEFEGKCASGTPNYYRVPDHIHRCPCPDMPEVPWLRGLNGFVPCGQCGSVDPDTRTHYHPLNTASSND